MTELVSLARIELVKLVENKVPVSILVEILSIAMKLSLLKLSNVFFPVQIIERGAEGSKLI